MPPGYRVFLDARSAVIPLRAERLPTAPLPIHDEAPRPIDLFETMDEKLPDARDLVMSDLAAFGTALPRPA